MANLELNANTLKSFYDNRYNGVYMQDHEWLDMHRVRSLLSGIPGTVRTILDYGCGQGQWVEVLSNTFSSGEICGIDISSKAIELAVKKYPQYRFFHFDGEVAPLATDSFDLIYSYHVLEHVYDMQKTVFDISRLLKNGGYLCIISPCSNKGSFEEKTARLVQDGKEVSIDNRERFFYEDIGHIRRLKSEELIKLFAQYNLKICKEFYAYQFWGAIEWISKSDRAIINKIFDNKNGINFLAKTKLLFFKIIFLILAIPMKLYTTNVMNYIKSDKKITKKMLLAALIPFKIITIPFGKIIDFFSFLEWHYFKTAKNGSAQYLIFKK